MVPDTYTNFFIASAGAGAALLGLLFVSLSISPEEKITSNASVEKRISAYGALSSLINAFFISLAALLPSNFGVSVFIFGLISFAISLQNALELLRPHEGASRLARRLILVVLNLLVYVSQCYYAVLLVINPHDPTPVSSLTTLLLIVYILGIIRAWELLGGTRKSAINLLIPDHKPQSSASTTDETSTTMAE